MSPTHLRFSASRGPEYCKTRAVILIAQHGYLIENGRILMSGEAAVLSANPDIAAAYLGGHQKVDYHSVKHYRRRKRWLA